MKRRAVLLLMIAAFFALVFQTACSKTPSPDKVKAMMEITDIETKWVSRYYQPWPPRLQLVPQMAFRVKNISGKPLSYVFFNAIFKEKDNEQNVGDQYKGAIGKKPVMPGEFSEVITLRSQFGVDGKNLESIKNHPLWKTWVARLFVQTKGSIPVLLGEWEVSRNIDFKEPEPVGPDSSTPKKEEKKDEKKDAVKIIK